MKHFYNPDPYMEAVKLFEEKSVRGGRHSVINDALGMLSSWDFTSN